MGDHHTIPYYLIAFLLYIKVSLAENSFQFMIFMPFVISSTINAFFGMLISTRTLARPTASWKALGMGD